MLVDVVSGTGSVKKQLRGGTVHPGAETNAIRLPVHALWWGEGRYSSILQGPLCVVYVVGMCTSNDETKSSETSSWVASEINSKQLLKMSRIGRQPLIYII